MKYKKGLIFICLIFCLFGVFSVSASDVNGTVVASENITSDNLSMDEQDNDLAMVSNDEISKFNNDSEVLNVSENNEFFSAVNASESLALSDTVEVLSSGPIVPAIGNSYTSAEEIWDEAKKTSVADRTFKIGKYKVTLSKSQYYYLLLAPLLDDFAKEGEYPEDFGFNDYYYVNDEDRLSCGIYKKTGMYVTIKWGLGDPKFVAKKVKSFKTKKQAKTYVKKVSKKWYKYFRYYDYKKVGKKYVVYKHMTKFKKVVNKKLPVYIGISYGYGARYMNFDYRYAMGPYLKIVYGYRVIYQSDFIRYSKWSDYLSTLNKHSTHKY